MPVTLPHRNTMIDLIESLIPEIEDDYRTQGTDPARETELRELQDERAEMGDVVVDDERAVDLDEQINSLVDELACMDVTVGFDPRNGDWNYQTGDNSYTGGAYGLPHWAVVTISRDSNPGDVADEILSQWADLVQGSDEDEDEDEDEVNDPGEPGEEDAIVRCDGSRFYASVNGKGLRHPTSGGDSFSSSSEAVRAIVNECGDTLSPVFWFVDDHGGSRPMSGAEIDEYLMIDADRREDARKV